MNRVRRLEKLPHQILIHHALCLNLKGISSQLLFAALLLVGLLVAAARSAPIVTREYNFIFNVHSLCRHQTLDSIPWFDLAGLNQ